MTNHLRFLTFIIICSSNETTRILFALQWTNCANFLYCCIFGTLLPFKEKNPFFFWILEFWSAFIWAVTTIDKIWSFEFSFLAFYLVSDLKRGPSVPWIKFKIKIWYLLNFYSICDLLFFWEQGHDCLSHEITVFTFGPSINTFSGQLCSSTKGET